MAQPARDLTPYKRKMIQLIHVAKSKLAMEDEDYRAMLLAQTGKSSSSAMSMSELEQVLEHLRSLGFDAQGRPAAKARSKRLADDPQSKLIRHMWLRLHELGAVKDSSEGALAAFVKRQTKVDRLEWLNGYQATIVIESLKRWLLRLGERL